MFEYEFCMRICWKCSKCTTPLRVSTRPTKSHLRRRKSRRWINRWWFRWSRAIYHSKLVSLLRSGWCGCRSQLRSLRKSRRSCFSKALRSRWRTAALCMATWRCRWCIGTHECCLLAKQGTGLVLDEGKSIKVVMWPWKLTQRAALRHKVFPPPERDEKNRKWHVPDACRGRDRQRPDEEANQLRCYRADVQNILDRSFGFIRRPGQHAWHVCSS